MMFGPQVYSDWLDPSEPYEAFLVENSLPLWFLVVFAYISGEHFAIVDSQLGPVRFSGRWSGVDLRDSGFL